MLQREARLFFSLLSEGVDLAGDTTMLIAILQDAQDPLRRAGVQAIVVPICVSFGLSAVISLVALVIRAGIVMTQLRRRRRDLETIVSGSKTYVEKLEEKLENGQHECKQVARSPRILCCELLIASRVHRCSCLASTQIYIDIGLALFEDVPMGIIGLHFLAVKYKIPLFQAISLIVSWLLLGTKISAIKTLPMRWARLGKWRKFAQPEVTERCHDMELPDVLFSESTELTDSEVVDELSKLRAHIELASRRFARTKGADSIREELNKMHHRLAVLADSAELASSANSCPTTSQVHDMAPATRRPS